MAEVTVVGGGIAGLIAAITAAEQGCRVHLFEERSVLGGRARTTPPPYRANLGGHALYADGVFWHWLDDHQLLPETVGRGGERLRYRCGEAVYDRPPELQDALEAIVSHQAPHDLSFREWARPRLGAKATELLIALAFIVTFEADAGRLSAAFVHERLRRAIQPGVARYLVGGWQALVDRLADEAAGLDVAIKTRHKVTELPAAPVIVATAAAAARRLLGERTHESAGPRVALYDLALADGMGLPSGLLDVDERLYLARYTAFDRTLAPDSEELVQISCGCRSGERFEDAQQRIERVLDSIAPRWRQQLRWSRRSLLAGATGATDLPGRTWRDRPPVEYCEGTYLAGDYVAAPGLLSEVSFVSGHQAGKAAAAFARAHSHACAQSMSRTPESHRTRIPG